MAVLLCMSGRRLMIQDMRLRISLLQKSALGLLAWGASSSICVRVCVFVCVLVCV